MNYLAYFHTHNDHIVTLLEKLVVRASATGDKAAIDALGHIDTVWLVGRRASVLHPWYMVGAP